MANISCCTKFALEFIIKRHSKAGGLNFARRCHPIVAAIFEANRFEVRFATLDFLALNFWNFQPAGGAFGFTDQIHIVLAVLLLPHNGPIGIVGAERRLHLEPIRQFEK